MTSPALLLLIPVLAALPALASRWAAGWHERGITATGSWPRTLLAATATATLTGLLTATHAGTAQALAVAAATQIAVLAVSTDLACRMIPREVPHVATIIGLIAFATQFSWPALISLAVTGTALVVLPWIGRALTRNGLGFSDIRLLGAFTATLAWWTGPDRLIWALLGAALLQGAAHALARPLRLGRLVPVPDRDGNPTGRTRRELPFAPALVAAFTAATIHAVATGASACAALAAC